MAAGDDEPADNSQLNWPVLAKFVTTGGGDSVISTKGVWNEAYNNNLLGVNGGLGFFNSADPNAERGVKVPTSLSPYEIGILKDIGYTMRS